MQSTSYENVIAAREASARHYAAASMTFNSMVDDRAASLGGMWHTHHPLAAQPTSIYPAATQYGPSWYEQALDWQLSRIDEYDGEPSFSAVATRIKVSDGNVKRADVDEEEDDVGCMLHTIGEWCGHCGEVPKDAMVAKFAGGPKMPERLYISSGTDSIFDEIYFRSEVSLPGLGQPRPKPAPKVTTPIFSTLEVKEACGNCGTHLSMLKKNGPGHCAGCRFMWLADWRAEQGKKIEAAKVAKKAAKKAKTGSRYDWHELGYSPS